MNGRVVSTEIGVIRACAWAGAVIAGSYCLICDRAAGGKTAVACRIAVYGGFIA